jgi:hypothetical protein
MHIITQAFTVIIILLFNAYVIHVLRKELLEYQYALMLLGAGLGMLFFAIFPSSLTALSHLLGIGIPLNLIYFAAILFCLLLIFQLIVAVSRMRRSIYELVQEVSILKKRLLEAEQQASRQPSQPGPEAP